jgi:hypothetical protein
MRQHTRGTILQAFLAQTAYFRVAVEAQVTGDINAPGWEPTVLVDLEVNIAELSVRERVERGAEYGGRQTHEGFCEDAPELVAGARLVETYRRYDDGAWRAVEADAAQRWLILAKSYVAGMPEPHAQVRLDLHRLGPVRA